MDVLLALAAVGGFGLVIWLGSRWSQRRFHQVDRYHEREEHSDPLTTDVSSWRGGRGF